MNGTPKAIGFIYKNIDGNRPKGDYVNTVDQVERITGIDFFPSLPDNIEKKVEAESNLNRLVNNKIVKLLRLGCRMSLKPLPLYRLCSA